MRSNIYTIFLGCLILFFSSCQNNQLDEKINLKFEDVNKELQTTLETTAKETTADDERIFYDDERIEYKHSLNELLELEKLDVFEIYLPHSNTYINDLDYKHVSNLLSQITTNERFKSHYELAGGGAGVIKVYSNSGTEKTKMLFLRATEIIIGEYHYSIEGGSEMAMFLLKLKLQSND